MGIYPEYKENGAMAAEAAARYFGGESLKTMTVLWPSRPLHAVNLIVARRLGIPLPEKVIQTASEAVR